MKRGAGGGLWMTINICEPLLELTAYPTQLHSFYSLASLGAVRAIGQQEKLFVAVILILIFAEALGLYGLIVALILSTNSYDCKPPSSD